MQLDDGRKLYILANQLLPTGKQKLWEQMPDRRFWGILSAASRPTSNERELWQLLDRFMANIPRENRLIFLRRYWYLDTTAEIAGRYGISQRRVTARLHRTREKLHAFLRREGISL